MKKITIAIGLALALALPAGAVAKPHPDSADKRNAFGKCVSGKAKEEETA